MKLVDSDVEERGHAKLPVRMRTPTILDIGCMQWRALILTELDVAHVGKMRSAYK